MTSWASVICRTTGFSLGWRPWSTTPEQGPPEPGCVRAYQRSPCPPWSTSPSGRPGGVAPPPLPRHKLTAGALADALRSCLDEPAYRHRAAELARRIRAEDGSAAVLTLIARLAG
jgi:hypothetical protein